MDEIGVETHGGGQRQQPGRSGSVVSVGSRLAAGRDIVDLLIRDLRALVRTVEFLGDSPLRGEAELEGFDQFVAGLTSHLVIEELVVRPVITRVLEREELIEQRKADIHLIVRRLARARDIEGLCAFQTRMRHVRVDLAEHAQMTEIGLLSHAYRVYDREARHLLAHRHPEAVDQLLDEFRQCDGSACPEADRIDRAFLTRLEEVASEALDIEGLATASAVKAVPSSLGVVPATVRREQDDAPGSAMRDPRAPSKGLRGP